MAVVINELEVVVEAPSSPQPAQRSRPEPAAAQSTPQTVAPANLETIYNRMLLYRGRVFAH